MVARCAFSTPIVSKGQEDTGVAIALESWSPHLFIVGTELGGLIGIDTRTATREAFRLRSDLKWGKDLVLQLFGKRFKGSEI